MKITDLVQETTTTTPADEGAWDAMKTGGRFLGRALGPVGLALSAQDAYDRWKKGDRSGAVLAALGGAAGMVPGIGTAASLGIAGGLAAKDAMAAGQKPAAQQPTLSQNVSQQKPAQESDDDALIYSDERQEKTKENSMSDLEKIQELRNRLAQLEEQTLNELDPVGAARAGAQAVRSGLGRLFGRGAAAGDDATAGAARAAPDAPTSGAPVAGGRPATGDITVNPASYPTAPGQSAGDAVRAARARQLGVQEPTTPGPAITGAPPPATAGGMATGQAAPAGAAARTGGPAAATAANVGDDAARAAGKGKTAAVAAGAAAVPVALGLANRDSEPTGQAAQSDTGAQGGAAAGQGAQPAQDVDSMSFGQAFKAARAAAKAAGHESTGQFTWRGKQYQTNVQGEPYVPMNQQKPVKIGGAAPATGQAAQPAASKASTGGQSDTGAQAAPSKASTGGQSDTGAQAAPSKASTGGQSDTGAQTGAAPDMTALAAQMNQTNQQQTQAVQPKGKTYDDWEESIDRMKQIMRYKY